MRSGSSVWILILAVLCGVSSIGWAESNAAEVDEPAPSAPAEPETLNVPPSAAGPPRDGAAPPPGIDSLLQLPAGFVPSSERTAVAGASEAEWRRRFRRTRGELDQARNALESTKRELDSVADEGGGSQWNVAPAVGGGNSPQGNSPISFKLRQELKRNRESVEQAEKALRQLQIEADLAGVPVAWREESDSPSSGARKELPTP